MAAPLVVDSREALAALAARRPGSPADPAPKVRFALPQLSGEENERLGRRCNRLLVACGCETGAATAIAAAGIYAVAASQLVWGEAYTPWEHIGLGALAFFFCGLAGKLIGLGISRYRLRNLLRHLLRQTAGPDPTDRPDRPETRP